jgi:hypothetical protein
MSNPYDTQVGGNHYQTMKIQPAEFINKNEMKFAEGNAIKYICRHVNKGGLQDLQKAKHYIDMIIERDYADEAKGSSVDSGLDINIEDVKISYANDELNGAIYYPSGASVGQEGFDE